MKTEDAFDEILKDYDVLVQEEEIKPADDVNYIVRLENLDEPVRPGKGFLVPKKLRLYLRKFDHNVKVLDIRGKTCKTCIAEFNCRRIDERMAWRIICAFMNAFNRVTIKRQYIVPSFYQIEELNFDKIKNHGITLHSSLQLANSIQKLAGRTTEFDFCYGLVYKKFHLGRVTLEHIVKTLIKEDHMKHFDESEYELRLSNFKDEVRGKIIRDDVLDSQLPHVVPYMISAREEMMINDVHQFDKKKLAGRSLESMYILTSRKSPFFFNYIFFYGYISDALLDGRGGFAVAYYTPAFHKTLNQFETLDGFSYLMNKVFMIL